MAFKFPNLIHGNKSDKEFQKKEARGWINEHIVYKQNASYKEALICFDISD